MDRILKSILYILLILLVLAAGGFLYHTWYTLTGKATKPNLILKPGSLEWGGLPPIELPATLATNPAASNACFEANNFRTNLPWIAASNGKIYAGLYSRSWAMIYDMDTARHEVGLIFGPDYYGAYYHFNPIGKLVVGGQIVYDSEQIKVGGTVGWRFGGK